MEIEQQIAQLRADAHGKEISLTDANVMIKEFLDLEKFIVKTIDPKVPDEPTKRKVTELMGRDFNAFVFDKKLIQRFFDGSMTDPAGNPQECEFLMVLLGAHSKDETLGDKTVKAGSFTVVTVGTNLKTVQQAGKDVPVFVPLLGDKPGNEYPPKTVVTELKTVEGFNKDVPVLVFKVID